MNYIPKIGDAIFASFLCIISMLIGVRIGVKYQWALNIGALVFALITAVILWMLIVENQTIIIDSMSRFAEAFARLDDEGRAAIAFQFPTLRYRMKRGLVREMFEDTGVTIDQFRLFLNNSNSLYISPERNWMTREQPHAIWLEIKLWLEEMDYIIPDSATGNRSWLWKGNAYNHLVAYWLAGRKVANLSDLEGFQPPPRREETPFAS